MGFSVRRYNEAKRDMEVVDVPINVGDGVSYSINGDSYPCTVRKISPSGKTVWVSRDEFRGTPGANSYEVAEKVGVFIPRDADKPETWKKFTKRQDGRFREVGTNYCYLSPGRSYSQDPHF
jgi:hypothetical protein